MYRRVASYVLPYFFSPTPSQTTKFIDFKNKYADIPITKIEVARKPLSQNISRLLNILSLGDFKEKMRKLNYDKIYHNYLIVTFANGEKYIIQRDQTINYRPFKKYEDEESYNIPLHGKNLNIKDLIDNANVDAVYDPTAENCQDFVEKVIKSAGLYNGLPDKVKELIRPQDGKKLLESLGSLKHLPKKITDLANIIAHKTGIGAGIQMIHTRRNMLI